MKNKRGRQSRDCRPLCQLCGFPLDEASIFSFCEDRSRKACLYETHARRACALVSGFCTCRRSIARSRRR